MREGKKGRIFLFLSLMVLLGIRARGKRWKEAELVEGFSQIAEFAYSWDSYVDYRGRSLGWGAYAVPPGWDSSPPPQRVGWYTSPPGEKKDTIFVFVASTGEDPGEVSLSLHGETLLTFDSGISENRVWWGADSWLLFDFRGYYIGNSGVFYLFVPREKIIPGKPSKIEVSFLTGSRRAWFMLKNYPDALRFEGREKHLRILSEILSKESKRRLRRWGSERVKKIEEKPGTILLLHFEEEGKEIYDAVSKTFRGYLGGGKRPKKGVLLFEGKNQWVEIPNLVEPEKEFALEAWIRPRKIIWGRQIIAEKEKTFRLSIFYHQLEGTVWIDGKAVSLSASVRERFSDGLYHWVGMSFDGYLLKLFADGERLGWTKVKGKMAKRKSSFRVSGPENPFRGEIEEVRLSRKAEEFAPVSPRLTPPPYNPEFILSNGSPFFPIGLFMAVPSGENLRELREAGFNLIGPRERIHVWDMEKAKRFLNLAERYGFKAWLSFWYKVNSPDIEMRVASILTKERKEKIKYLKDFVLNLKDYPSLLVWDIGDELVMEGTSLEGLKEGYHLLKELDPSHGVWINHGGVIEEKVLRRYSQWADVVSYDIYPFYNAKDESWHYLSQIGEITQLLRKAVEYKKPVWMILQADYAPGIGRFPTKKELRFMTYDAILQGATGIIYFGQDITSSWTPEFKQILKEIASELKILTPVFIAPFYRGRIKLSLNPLKSGIYGWCKRYEDKLYLVVINREPGRTVEVNFLFPEEGEIKEAEVLFENRAVKIRGNSFQDKLEGYAVRVYRLSTVK